MKLSTSSLSIAGVVALAGLAQSQNVMTEVRISTRGIDEEYVEIQGVAGQSTDGLMICVVEGDPSGTGGGEGTLDDVYDLAGDTFSASFYTLGSSAASAAFPGLIDNDLFGNDLFENSSLTVYLLSVPDPLKRADISSMEGNDIRDPAGSMTTIFTTDPAITILDAVAIWDGDMGDVFFDGAPVFGPDGSFLPSGVLRDGGCPGDWCNDTFVNFEIDGVPNPPYADPTPKSVNPTTACMTTPSQGICPGGAGIGTPYCATNANSTGASGALSATGSVVVATNDVTLMASSLPNNAFGFFLASLDAGFVANPGGSEGNLCLGGSIGRYVGPGEIQNTGTTGEFQLAIDLTAVPQPTGFVSVAAGETWRFQAWHRDAVMGSATSNFTNGLEIDFQ
ncbi:MAG: hypothetical protein AAF957_24695 [Planctomycetota bacterium]